MQLRSLLTWMIVPVAVLGALPAAAWRVGVAVESITPDPPIPLVGYGGRDKPFERVDQDIYLKALAFEDAAGTRAVLITGDLVGFQSIFFEESCERIMKETGLERGQIMLNASHNHTGPLLSLNPDPAGNLAHAAFPDPKDRENVVNYTRGLQDAVVRIALSALGNLEPASLAWGTDRVEFPMNRREVTPEGVWMRPNPAGATDKRVPVLRVTAPDGNLRAILVGCACHNTGLTADHNIISGDYAGYAQAWLEAQYPGAKVLFAAGCGADANPEPRSDVPGVRKLGQDLGEAVQRALAGEMAPIADDGAFRFAFERPRLPLMKLDIEGLRPFAERKTTESLMAKHMIQMLEGGKTLPEYQEAPIGVWAFGDDLVFVGLPSECVADYANRFYRELPDTPLWVSAYANEFFGYIPTAQIVREGGHEAIGVTTYLWGAGLETKCGFFTERVEQVMVETTTRMVKEVSGE